MWQHRAGREQGQGIANLLQSFMQSFTGPLEQWLDRQIDRRLVRTFFLALVAIVRLRHSRPGLLLSELGAHILSPGQAPAGTKGLSNPLRSPRWSHTLLERFLWRRADRALSHLEGVGRDGPGHLGRERAGEAGKHRPGGVVPSRLQQGGPSQARQARILSSTGKTAGFRAWPAMAHRHGGWDAGACLPGRHGLVDQPGQAGRPPPGGDRIPAFPVLRRMAEAGGPRL